MDLTKGIVYILNEDHEIKGTGFLINEKGWIVTCSHVVLGVRQQELAQALPETVYFSFFQEKSIVHTAQVLPNYLLFEEGDTVILYFEGSIPPMVKPLPLATSSNFEGQPNPFVTHGFPDDEATINSSSGGQIFPSKVMTKLGFEALELEDESEFIIQGFSGAPVWNSTTGYVVGMICSIMELDDASPKQGKRTFAIPSETIQSLYPTQIKLNIAPRNEQERIAQQLRKGSQNYYNYLRNNRFKHLNIVSILFPDIAQDDFLDTPVKLEETELPLYKSVQQLWDRPASKGAILFGEGGMGKTVSLVRLWEQLKVDEEAPIPIFIALNEYNASKGAAREQFVYYKVVKHYLANQELEPAKKNSLYELFRQLNPNTNKPSIIFLLDGFNEIVGSDTRDLLIELNELSQYAGIQTIVTSRFLNNHYTWMQDFERLELQFLKEKQIKSYLKEKKQAFPTNERLQTLLQNPMMLTLYTATCELVQTHKNRGEFAFKPLVESYGELMWNFLEAQLVKHKDNKDIIPQEYAYYTFLLQHLLPFIGHEMERQNLFSFQEEELEIVIKKACQHFYCKSFIKTFPNFRKYIKSFDLDKNDFPEDSERFEKIVDLLCNQLSFLVKSEDGSYNFLHQHFRDFFSALHLLNEAQKGIVLKQLPNAWKERVIPIYVRRIIGEIEGEHRNVPLLIAAEKRWSKDHYTETKLVKLLDQCRGIFEDEVIAYGVYNIIEVWKEVRKEIVGMDLRSLNWSQVSLNDIRLYRAYGRAYLASDLEGGKVKNNTFFSQGHTGAVNSVVISSDNQFIVSGSSDGSIKIWNRASGECLQTLREHNSGVLSVAISSDNQYLISGSYDTTIKIWHRVSGECLQTLKEHTGFVNSIVISLDNQHLISGSDDHSIKIWDLVSGQCLQTLKGHTRSVNGVAISPNNQYLISGSDDKSIKIWDWVSGECLQTLKGHTRSVNSVAISSDNQYLISGSDDKSIKIWDWVSGECLQTLKLHNSGVGNLVMSSDNQYLISGSYDNTIKIWNLASRLCIQTLKGHNSLVRSVAISSDNQYLISGSDDHSIKIWHRASGEYMQTLKGYSSSVLSVVISSDNQYLISGSDDYSIKIWDRVSGQCIQILKGHTDSVRSVAISSDNQYLISSSSDNSIKIWEQASGQCIKTLKGHTDSVRSVAISPDNQCLISGSEDHSIKIWDLVSGLCIQTFKGHNHWVRSVVISPDNQFIISGSSDNRIKIWNRASGECLRTLKHTDWLLSVAISPDSLYLISGSDDNSIKIWNWTSGNYLQTLKGHSGSVNSVAISSDNQYLISGSVDHTIKIWNRTSGKCIKTLKGHKARVQSVAISHDNQFIIAGSDDGTNRIWDRSSGKCLQTLKNELGLLYSYCSFKNLHPNSQLSKEDKELLRMYGAILDEKDEQRWEED